MKTDRRVLDRMVDEIEIEAAEAESLALYHDPEQNFFWYLRNQEHRCLVPLSDGCQVELLPDTTRRWKIAFYENGIWLHHRYLPADEHGEASTVFDSVIKALVRGHMSSSSFSHDRTSFDMAVQTA